MSGFIDYLKLVEEDTLINVRNRYIADYYLEPLDIIEESRLYFTDLVEGNYQFDSLAQIRKAAKESATRDDLLSMTKKIVNRDNVLIIEVLLGKE